MALFDLVDELIWWGLEKLIYRLVDMVMSRLIAFWIEHPNTAPHFSC